MDTVFDTSRGVEITPYVAKTKRTPVLPQVVNVALNGLAYIQTTGVLTYQLEVELVIHQNNDALLLRAWEYGSLIKVVDEGNTYQGYITAITLEDEYAEGYHRGNITIQEESAA